MPELAALHLAPWQWMLGIACALVVGIGKTGAPGISSLIVPLMVLLVNDARLAAAWTLPILITADIFAVWYWRRHAEARTLFSLIPWVLAGMAAGTAALSFSEPVLRKIVALVVTLMLITNLYQRWRKTKTESKGSGPMYGIAAGFSTTVANAAGPVMSLYLLSKRLPKEQFVATGAWFFLVVNLSKIPIYAGYHLFSRASLTFNALMVPAVIVGALAGRWIVTRIPQVVFDALIIVVTAASVGLLLR
jgi:uncharacterized membrane protein YfcA